MLIRNLYVIEIDESPNDYGDYNPKKIRRGPSDSIGMPVLSKEQDVICYIKLFCNLAEAKEFCEKFFATKTLNPRIMQYSLILSNVR